MATHVLKTLKGMIVVAALILSSCASVTITPTAQAKLSSFPDYEKSVDFYFWGLNPVAHDVNVNDICGITGVRQMQTQTTLVDGILTAVTLGIYAPRTIKIWCEGEA